MAMLMPGKRSKDKKYKSSTLSPAQQELLGKYAGTYGSPDAQASLSSMLGGGAPTAGIESAFIKERVIDPSMTAFRGALGETRAGAAGRGSFFSSAAKGKEAELARRMQEQVAQQTGQMEFGRKQFNLGLEESAKERMLRALGLGPGLAAGQTVETAIQPRQPSLWESLRLW